MGRVLRIIRFPKDQVFPAPLSSSNSFTPGVVTEEDDGTQTIFLLNADTVTWQPGQMIKKNGTDLTSGLAFTSADDQKSQQVLGFVAASLPVAPGSFCTVIRRGVVPNAQLAGFGGSIPQDTQLTVRVIGANIGLGPLVANGAGIPIATANALIAAGALSGSVTISLP